jgi:hypothetical protein
MLRSSARTERATSWVTSLFAGAIFPLASARTSASSSVRALNSRAQPWRPADRRPYLRPPGVCRFPTLVPYPEALRTTVPGVRAWTPNPSPSPRSGPSITASARLLTCLASNRGSRQGPSPSSSPTWSAPHDCGRLIRRGRARAGRGRAAPRHPDVDRDPVGHRIGRSPRPEHVGDGDP